MATSLISSRFIIVIIAMGTVASSSASSTNFRNIYAFGDSYTDTGNTNSSSGPSSFNHVSQLPYGTTFFHHPTNRYSDGRLMIDFVADYLSLPYLRPYRKIKDSSSSTTGVNFAVAGSTAIEHEFFVKNNLTLNLTPVSLETQLLWFDSLLKKQGCTGSTTLHQCSAVFDDALFWIGEIGANDYAYTIGSSVSEETIQNLAVRSLARSLEVLLKKGAKNIVVQGLPPTGCLPLALVLSGGDDRDDAGCVASVNEQSKKHNAALEAELQKLREEFPNAVVAYADLWNSYRRVITHAPAYGFRQPFRTCCGSGGGEYNFDVFSACGSPSSSACSRPSEFINWDGVHLTEAMYKVLAGMVLKGPYCIPPFLHLVNSRLH